MSQLDDLLTQLGTGRWTILHILVICYWFSLLSYHTLGGAFLAPKVDFACRPPAASAHARATNDSCAYFEEDPSTGRVEERPCAEWDFDNSTFTSTVTSEFGLVCEREYLRATYQSIYMLGIFVGAPLNGVMADSVLDESPRWLAVAGRQEKALGILKKAAERNRVDLPSDEKILSILKDDQRKEVQEKATHDNFKDRVKEYFETAVILFRTPRLRTITSVMYIDYLVVGLVFFGLSLGGGNLSADPFLYMALSGLVEVPANTVVVPVIARFARRTLSIFFFVVSGAALLALPFMPSGHAWAAVSLAMVGKMSITFTFNILFLFASEVFPTEVRTRGMGTSLMMSRIGAMVAPFVTESMGSVYPWAPSVVFGASSVVAGLATLALPETQGAALPDTISRFEARSRAKEVVKDPRVPAGGLEGEDGEQSN